MNLLRHPAAAIVGMALLLCLDAILSPAMSHDHFWINRVWVDQMITELARGNPYPRWLPSSHDGLGSPVFYYYPPAAFYLAGLVGLTGISTYASVIAAFFLGFVASGLTMHAWLKDSAKAPLLGTLLFMAAPYHVFDFYGRGALAEFFAIAIIPLIAVALKRAAAGRWSLLALAYGLIIITHLPLALLVSLLLVGPYGLYVSRGSIRSLAGIAAGCLAGVAVSAIYLLPALSLDQFRDSAKLWHIAGLQPESWSLLNWESNGAPPRLKLLIAAMVLAALQPIAAIVFSRYRAWGLYAFACCALATAIVPFFWSIPLLQSVQFPFRVLPLAEFAVATGVAHLDVRAIVRLAAAAPMFAVSLFLASGEPERAGADMPAERIARHPDVPENLPPGDRPHSHPSQWALDVASANPEKQVVNGRTVERLFYFPAWEVECEGRLVETSPHPQTQLLTYEGTGCERRLVMTGPERLGTAISAIALLVLMVLFALRRRPLGRQAGRIAAVGRG